MNLRKLELKDAPFMLEWMHDPTVVEYMQTDFAGKTLYDCKSFIEKSWNDKRNLHLAIVDKQDIYMGTVSLKNIQNFSAEFAITIRKSAMGKGYSKYATQQIFDLGRKQKGLKNIFWCVSPKNIRAIKFYDKNGYPRVDKNAVNHEGYTIDQVNSFIWYQISQDEENEKKGERVYGKYFIAKSSDKHDCPVI